MQATARNHLLEDAFWLLGGNVINAGCQLVTTLLLASILPASSWGGIAVIISYALIMETLFSTKNWQLVSSHAYPHLDTTPKRFSAHFGALFTTELTSNLLATILALTLLPMAIAMMNLPDSWYLAGSIYSISILFRFSGSAGAILRLSNKYLWQSIHASSLGATRLLAVALVLPQTHSPTIILTCLAIIESIWHVGLTAAAIAILKQKGVEIRDLMRNPWKRLHHQDWKLVATSHCTNLSKVATRELDVLFVSAFSSPEIAGVVKVYKSILRALLILSDPLANPAFPRFINFQKSKDPLGKITKLLRKLILLGTTISTAALSVLTLLIYAFWEDYTPLPSPLGSGYFLGYAIGIWIAVGLFCFPPANLALKRYGFALRLNIGLAAAYLVALTCLTPLFGAAGAGWTFAVIQALWAIGYLVSFKQLSAKTTP